MENNSNNALTIFKPEDLIGYSPLETKVLQAVLSDEEKLDAQKAEEIGISKVWYSNLKNSDKLKETVANVRARMLNENMFDILQKVIKVLNAKLLSEDEDIQLKATKQVLDFYTKQTTNEVSALNLEKNLLI